MLLCIEVKYLRKSPSYILLPIIPADKPFEKGLLYSPKIIADISQAFPQTTDENEYA